ncbi:MAG TPA: DUF3810 domain-containing protein [Candidatus Krumholzibacteria bacterium]
MRASDPVIALGKLRPASGVLAGASSLLLAALLPSLPSLAELYARSIGPAAGWTLARLSGVTSLALSELLMCGFALGVLLRGAWALRCARRSRRGRRWILGHGLLTTLNVAGWVVASFMWSWGFNYSRAPLEDRWALPEANPARLEEITTLLVDLANEYYFTLHGSEDAGSMSVVADRSALDVALTNAYARLSTDMNLGTSVGWRRGPAKTPRISPLMNRLGLSGFYFPWSGEANVNGEIPAIAYSHAVAHEKAHQRGYAPEDEANFMAILAGASAEQPLAQYSAILFAQRQLLRNLLRADPDAGQALLERRYRGVQRDVDELQEFWRRYRGRATEWAEHSNDLYLRAHRVEGGIHSYAGSAELLLRFAATAEEFPPRP